jgi:hypothetical protein
MAWDGGSTPRVPKATISRSRPVAAKARDEGDNSRRRSPTSRNGHGTGVRTSPREARRPATPLVPAISHPFFPLFRGPQSPPPPLLCPNRPPQIFSLSAFVPSTPLTPTPLSLFPFFYSLLALNRSVTPPSHRRRRRHPSSLSCPSLRRRAIVRALNLLYGQASSRYYRSAFSCLPSIVSRRHSYVKIRDQLPSLGSTFIRATSSLSLSLSLAHSMFPSLPAPSHTPSRLPACTQLYIFVTFCAELQPRIVQHFKNARFFFVFYPPRAAHRRIASELISSTFPIEAYLPSIK